MDGLTLLIVAGCIWFMLSLFMSLAWVVEQRTGNSGWVDVVWTCGVGFSGIISALVVPTVLSFQGDWSGRQLLVSLLMAVWALRLAGHIAKRTTTVSDDPRYVKLRAQWGPAAASRNMFWLLQAQAALSVPLVVAVALAAWNPAPLLTTLDLLAFVVFGAGLAGSTMSDLQLSRFKRSATSEGEVCDVGLWSWSRHPNYFFEWLVWVGFALFAMNMSGDWTIGYIALAAPACMYWLLRYVSGVPPLEEHMLEKYGAAYAKYQETTSVFFPWPPSSAEHIDADR